jgi:hypothetical protein
MTLLAVAVAGAVVAGSGYALQGFLARTSSLSRARGLALAAFVGAWTGFSVAVIVLVVIAPDASEFDVIASCLGAHLAGWITEPIVESLGSVPADRDQVLVVGVQTLVACSALLIGAAIGVQL